MLTGFLGLPIPGDVTLHEPVEIERAASELSEGQRQGVSTEADLDHTAPVFRVLDFLEEVLLAAASGDPVEGSLLGLARGLLQSTNYVIGILDILRSLVSTAGIPAQRKSELGVDSANGRIAEQTGSGNEQPPEEAAFLAQRPICGACDPLPATRLWGSRAVAHLPQKRRGG